MWLDVLRKMKKTSGKTSQIIAEETGIPKSTIDKLLTGRTKDPALSMVRSIVHCLGYTLDDLDDTKKDTVPTKDSEDDKQKEKLINNYERLNDEGRDKLIEYSQDLVDTKKYVKSNAGADKVGA